MGFELPSALLGVLLVGGPLLAHLVRRRNLPDASLPTVRFLARAVAESQRRHRVTNLLLLVLRMLAVALAALGVAAPFVLVPVLGGDGQRTALAIVVDDSRSMMAESDEGSLLDQALDEARRAIRALPEGSTATVVLAGAPPRVLVRSTADLGAAAAALGNVASETARTGALSRAVTLATHALHTAPPGLRRLVVLSDFAEHERPLEIRWPTEGIEVEPVWLRPTSRVNRRVFVADRTVDPNAPRTLLVRAQVLSDGNESKIRVRLEHDGAALDEQEVSLADGSGTAVLAARLPKDDANPGSAGPVGTLRIDGRDSLPLDDTAPVLLRSPEATRILLVNGDPRPMPADDEVGFVVRAISLGEGERGDGFRARVVDPAAAGTNDLEWADMVVLANVALAPGRFADQLLRAVESGTGLLITGGHRVRPAALRAALGEALPARMEVASTARVGPGLFLVGASGGPGAALPGLSNARFGRRHGLEPRAQGTRIDAVFADGAAALVSGEYGRGRVATFAIPLDDDFGDLPYRPGFLPMLTELLASLGGKPAATENQTAPGQAVDLSRFTRLGPLDVILPSGARRTLGEDGDGMLRDTSQAGVYRLERGGRYVPEASFVIQAPLEESDLASEGAPAVNAAKPPEGAAGMLRRPLGPLVFLLAAALFALEGLLRQRWPAPRRGPPRRRTEIPTDARQGRRASA